MTSAKYREKRGHLNNSLDSHLLVLLQIAEAGEGLLTELALVRTSLELLLALLLDVSVVALHLRLGCAVVG